MSRYVTCKYMTSTIIGILIIAVLQLGVVGTAMADPPTVTVVEVTTFQNPDGSAIPEEDRTVIAGSSSTLERKNNKISMTIDTDSLPAGAYTIWWHLETGEPNESILWATYTIVGEDGEGSFSGTLKENKNPGFVFLGEGLDDARGGDVELFIRYHGPARFDEPEILNLQLTDPFGGCTDGRNPMPTEDDFDCYNPQIAVHGTP